MLKFNPVVFLLILGSNKVLSFQTYNNFDQYRNPRSLDFEEGDVLACRIHSNAGSVIYGAEHIMLATNSREVAHIVVYGNRGRLREDNFVDITGSKGYTMCRIATSQYDSIMFDLGIKPRTGNFEYSSDIGDWVYYDLYGCNCEHWVTYWRYGKAWSDQSNQAPNYSCRLMNQISRSSNTGAVAYAKRGQAGARADGTVGKATFGSGIVNGEASGPSVGAYAEAGGETTGAGLKASVGNVRLGVGKTVGVSLGLAADTGAHIGRDGVGIKVLGTGWEVTKSKGAKICFFGSCIHIG